MRALLSPESEPYMPIIIKTKMIEAECVRYTDALRAIGFISEPDYVKIARFAIHTDVSDVLVGNKTRTKIEWRMWGHREVHQDWRDAFFDVPGFVSPRELAAQPGKQPKRDEPKRSKRGAYAALVQSRRTIEFLAEQGFTIAKAKKSKP
jgi:hypothetical protein